MSQITIYLGDTAEKEVRRRAKSEGVSVSHWIALAIEAYGRDCWPPDVLASLGTWNDIEEVEKARATFGRDTKREHLD